jgi:immune inhibitor A
VALLALILTGAVLTAWSMPLHPSLQARIASGEMAAPANLGSEDIPGPPKTIDMLRQRALDENMNIIAILVDFSDNPSQVEPSFFDTLLYGAERGSVSHFWNEVTYGNLTLVTLNFCSSTGWYRAPQTYDYYVNNQRGFGTYPRNASRLTEDAVTIADEFVDFSQYDPDNDGRVEGLFIVHAGPGYEITGNLGDIHSHASGLTNPVHCDGVIVDRYSMEPEFWQGPGDMTCGVYAHEMGHAVFGLPDLYDTDGGSNGLGSWSLMAGGSWNGPLGGSPAHPDAWCLFRISAVTPIVLTGNQLNVQIPAIAQSPVVYRLWANGAVGSEFYLVENRQRIGYDAALPGTGLLIYHIDQTVNSNNNPWYPGNTSNGHYRVALEQADGQWGLETGGSNGDPNDPYPGNTQNHAFSNTTVPNSRNYRGNLTRVTVRNISASADTMTADLGVRPGPDNSIFITIPDTTAGVNDLLCVPISMDTVVDEDAITSVHLRIRCDSTVLHFANPPYQVNGGRLPDDWTVTEHHSAGILVFDADGQTNLTGIGSLICLNFETPSTAFGGQISPVAITEFAFGPGSQPTEITSGSITILAADMAFFPASLSFNNVAVGQTLRRVFTVRNTGNAALDIYSIIAPAGFTTNFGEPVTLDEGTSLTVQVSFTPEAEQAYHDSLTLECSIRNGQVRFPVSGNGVLSADPAGLSLPTEFAMNPCYPNPFNPATAISLDIPRSSLVTVSVYDLLGRLIDTPLHGTLEPGRHQLNWSCPDCGSGMYLFVLSASGQQYLQKALLLK